MKDVDGHADELVHEVIALLDRNDFETEAEASLGNIQVGTWVDDHDKFHITIGRGSKRNDFVKRIAIPQDKVVTVIALMILQLAKFRFKVAQLSK